MGRPMSETELKLFLQSQEMVRRNTENFFQDHGLLAVDRLLVTDNPMHRGFTDIQHHG